MQDLTPRNFGLLIAYVLPGFVALTGFFPGSPSLRRWLVASTSGGTTVAGFLYMTLASVAVGLLLSTVRWLLIDPIHHHTGIRPPRSDFRRLTGRDTALELLIEGHYRYYQWYANMLLAIPCSVGGRCWFSACTWPELLVGTMCWIVFFLGSRDTLAKYYQRSQDLLSA